MTTQFQPPPTYADPVIVDEATRKGQFNPLWLKWFLDLSQFINNNGGGSAIQHNSLGGLQGGTANQYYHLNQTTYAILNNIGTPTAGSVAYGTGSTVAFSPVGSSGQVLTSGGAGSPTWSTPAGGSVTSVGLSLPTEFTVSNSPVTSAGTLTAVWKSETAKYFFAAPNAAAGTPTFRLIVASDIPALSYAPQTSGTSILYGNGSGGFSNVTVGSGLSFVTGTLTATGSGGTVTSVAALTLGTTGTDLSSTVANSTTTPVITLNVPTASATNRGALSSADWTTFNNKQPAGTYVTSVTGTAPVVSSGGTTPAISMAAASASVNGYLTSTDWSTFNSKGSGTVTSVTGTAPVVSSGGATPAISIAAASASVNGYLTSTDWSTFNGKQPAGAYLTAVTSDAPLTGAGTAASHLSMPAATTSVSGYLTSTDWNTFNNKGSGSVTSVSFTGGIISVATATTTPALTVAGTSGGIPYFASGTTWASSGALTQYGVVYGGGAGAAPVATAAGTTGQVLTATTGGAPTWAAPATSGTVTSVSVVSANGFAGTVATSTTTPAITLTTTITGLLKGNGTAISAAVANTDYVPLSTVLTKTADYTIANTDMWIINNKTGSALTLTFPAASSWTGRQITVKNMQAQAVNSASSNIVPIDSTTAGTAILLNVVGNWATLVSDGTNWVIMQAASNNNLLLE